MINKYIRAREENIHVDFETIRVTPRAQLAKQPPLVKNWETKCFTIEH